MVLSILNSQLIPNLLSHLLLLHQSQNQNQLVSKETPKLLMLPTINQLLLISKLLKKI